MREKISKKIVTKLSVMFVLVLACTFIAPEAVGNAATDIVSPKMQKAVDLRRQGKFKASNSAITMQTNEKAKGIMISGDAADFSNTVFSYGDGFVFEKNQVEYLLVDALAERRKKIELAFYLDNDKKPFATISLGKQKKAEIWSTVKSRCVNLAEKKLSGSHKLRFKVVTQETGNLSFVFRSLSIIKSDIPMVEFNLDESEGSISEMNGDYEHNTECYGKVSLNIPEGYKSEYTDAACKSVTYELDYIRGRGNSTWMVKKKPYKFKLETKQDLLGMGKNKHWILLANYYDVTMLRNKFTYWLGAELGMEFTPQCEFVNVIMNGEYLGSYYLCEQVRVGKSRVNIDDLEKDEETKVSTDDSVISGGYLLAMSPYGDELNQTFSTNQGYRFLIESPSFKDYINETQVNYIRDYVQKTEDAIYGDNFQENGISYQDYLDIDSAIDYYWIQEISMNGDAFGSPSTYLYKKRNGKLYWGPLWDFDFVAWGATEYYNNNCEGFMQNSSVWFQRLFEDPVFYQKAVARWSVIKEKLLEAAEDGGQIDIYSKKQYESQKANYGIWEKYSDSYGEGWWFEDGTAGINSTQITYDSEVERLKSWVKQRVEWIDANLSNLKRTYFTVKFMLDEDTEYTSLQIEKDRYIDMIPSEPYQEGYVFKGWYVVKEQDGEVIEYPITEETRITEDIIVKAKWQEKAELKPLEQIGFAREEYYMFYDDSMMLKYSVLPFDADDSDFVWSSSDDSVVTVENGVVFPKARSGEAVITATAPNGASAACVVHIMDYRDYTLLQAIEIDKKSMTVSKGGYARISAKPVPKNAVLYRDFTYVSSDEEILQVDSCGYVYGVTEGTALVVIYGSNGEEAKPVFCTVTVVDDGRADIMPVFPSVPTPDVTPEPTPDITPTPDVTPEPIPDITPEPDATPEPEPDVKPDLDAIPIKIESTQASSDTTEPTPDKKIVKKGTEFEVNGLKYKVLAAGNKKTVACIGVKNAGKKLTIPATVTYQNMVFKVTVIEKKAFFGEKKLTKIILGKNITEIGSKAFAQCKKLKELTIKSAVLKKAGKGVLTGVSSKLKLKAPKGKKAKYQKILNL